MHACAIRKLIPSLFVASEQAIIMEYNIVAGFLHGCIRYRVYIGWGNLGHSVRAMYYE